MIIIDQWTGGASPFCRLAYRVIVATADRPAADKSAYRLESKHIDDEDTAYREVVGYSRRDIIARGIMRWMIEQYEEREERNERSAAR